MKTAADAFKETKFCKEIIDFKQAIETQIEKAISSGNYECEVTFSTDVPDSIRNKVRDELQRLGYTVTIPKHEERPFDCPADQWRYYDMAKINWMSDTMKNELARKKK